MAYSGYMGRWIVSMHNQVGPSERIEFKPTDGRRDGGHITFFVRIGYQTSSAPAQLVRTFVSKLSTRRPIFVRILLKGGVHFWKFCPDSRIIPLCGINQGPNSMYSMVTGRHAPHRRSYPPSQCNGRLEQVYRLNVLWTKFT